MSQTSVSPLGTRHALRAVVAVVAALAVLAPAAYLFSQVWTSNTETVRFNAAERRGVAYLGPLTQLLSAVTEAQSDAVREDPVDAAAVRRALAAVDRVDGRLGGQLRTTERWTAIRQTVVDRTSRGWPDPEAAYQQYSDLVTTLIELTRKVGDVSNLILDPRLDAYYVMNATLLRIPAIIVDSGRYADLAVLGNGSTDPEVPARLTAARNRIAGDAQDLADGLVKAFGATASGTLGPGLTSQLDDFRTAVDAVAPSTSLLAPTPQRTPSALAADQDELQAAAIALQQAGLTELDRLLEPRESAAARTRVLAVVAVALVALVVLVAAVLVVLLPDRAAGGAADPAEQVEPEPYRDGALAGAGAGPPGGARAAR